MQLQFEKKGLPYLRTVKREVQSQEQTQEIRIGDGMPDIGSIIGAWGQVILRSKEWQEDGMMVSGGTMVWVQYLPEEGGQPQYMESWIPFQMRWNFPETRYDGKILTQCILRSVDARSTSARKIMLRTNVSVLAWALENASCEVYSPVEIPEDIYLKQTRYPVLIPSEAGEKAFVLEESLQLPPSVPKIEKIISYGLCPGITEEKIMNDKVIFRGNAMLRILYLSEDGGQYAWDFDLPFTQYAELEKEYGDDSEVLLIPCVTALEVDREEDTLAVKIGLVCQYRICHRPVVEITEDAYAIRRKLDPMQQQLQLPGILDNKEQTIHMQSSMALEAMRLTDIEFVPLPVRVHNGEENTVIEVSGQFRLFYYDMEGTPRTGTQKWEQKVSLPQAEEVNAEAVSFAVSKPQATLMSGSVQLGGELKLIVESSSTGSIPMITGLEVGEMESSDPKRPSVILRKPGEKSLWELAKEHGSSEEAIREANGLQEEPDETRMLLIPVL